jgi:hypothetical protein
MPYAGQTARSQEVVIRPDPKTSPRLPTARLARARYVPVRAGVHGRVRSLTGRLLGRSRSAVPQVIGDLWCRLPKLTAFSDATGHPSRRALGARLTLG